MHKERYIELNSIKSAYSVYRDEAIGVRTIQHISDMVPWITTQILLDKIIKV